MKLTKKQLRAITTKYSGKNSNEFWDVVNKLTLGNHQELYSLGCALQNLEEFVLKALKDAINSEKTNENPNPIPNSRTLKH